MPLITPPFRVSFPSLVEATGYQGSDPKYSVTAIWNKDELKTKYTASWRAILTALDEKAKEFFDRPLGQLPPNIRRGIRNGAEKEHLNGYGADVLFASLSSDRRPQVVGLRRQRFTADDIKELVYPGCYARASVNVYAYDNIGKGLALGLNNLQWLGHGDRLDSVTTAEQDFDVDPDDVWFQAEDAAASEHTDDPESRTHDLDDADIPF